MKYISELEELMPLFEESNLKLIKSAKKDEKIIVEFFEEVLEQRKNAELIFVANKIKQDTKSFKFKNNIKTGAICRLIVHLDESVFRGLDKYKILIELITGGTLDEFKDNLRKGLRNTKYNIKIYVIFYYRI